MGEPSPEGGTKLWWKNMDMKTHLQRSGMEGFLGLRYESSSLKQRFPIFLLVNWPSSSIFEDLQPREPSPIGLVVYLHAFRDMEMEKSCFRCHLPIFCSLSDNTSFSLQTHLPHFAVLTQPLVLGPSWGSQVHVSFHSGSPKHCSAPNYANLKRFSSL